MHFYEVYVPCSCRTAERREAENLLAFWRQGLPAGNKLLPRVQHQALVVHAYTRLLTHRGWPDSFAQMSTALKPGEMPSGNLSQLQAR